MKRIQEFLGVPPIKRNIATPKRAPKTKKNQSHVFALV